MKKVNRVIFASIMLLLFSTAALAEPSENAIARVYANNGRDGGQSGTGFFIKINGHPYICTAYHVVVGASSLDIRCNSGKLSNISIAAFDSEKDLVLINFTPEKNSVPIIYFQILSQLPDHLVDMKGTIIGHPNTLTYQHLPVSFLSNRYVASRTYDFFRPSLNIDLLSIYTPIYGGMSGAPVILNDRVVGVVSGSYNEGGGITWAISANYINSLRMMSTPLRDLSKLPPLNMFISGNNASSLTRSFKFIRSIGPNYAGYQRSNVAFLSDNKEFQTLLESQDAVFNGLKTSIVSSKDFQKLQAALDNALLDIGQNVKRIGQLKDKNAKNEETWHTNLTNLENSLNNEQYQKFSRENGGLIHARMDKLNDSIQYTNQFLENVNERSKGIITTLQKDLQEKNFDAYKSHAFDWVQISKDQISYIRETLYIQNKIIALSDILENAMIECQQYQVNE